jgi:hypothetical protein
MLNSGKKFLTLVLSENKFLNEKKNHNPPCKLNGRSLNCFILALSTRLAISQNLLWKYNMVYYYPFAQEALTLLVISDSIDRNGEQDVPEATEQW